jgi:orotate phosphoribosyltransferase-like protein
MIMIYGGSESLDDLASTIDKITGELAEHGSEYDTIVVSGLSGTLVGPAVAYMLGKRLVVIRKPGDSAHTSRHPGLRSGEPNDIGRWIFLDDFISLGGTRNRVREEIVSCETAGTEVATFTYDNGLGRGWQAR